MVDQLKIDKLVRHIDDLVEQLITKEKARETQTVFSQHIDIDVQIGNILENGLYDPKNPTAIPRRALFAIGETLGIIGGIELMRHVTNTYSGVHGAEKTRKIYVTWETAAGLWYN